MGLQHSPRSLDEALNQLATSTGVTVLIEAACKSSKQDYALNNWVEGLSHEAYYIGVTKKNLQLPANKRKF